MGKGIMVQSTWYKHIGKGLCTNVKKEFYKDHNEDTMDAEKCAIHCNDERECLYFSVNANANKCRTYNPKSGKCTSSGAQDYEIYKSRFNYASY